MKTRFILSTLTLLMIVSEGQAADDNLLILGNEVRLGYKMNPVFRGHKVEHYLLDQQFSTGFSINSQSDINLALYHYATLEAHRYGNWGLYIDNPWLITQEHKIAPFFVLNYYDDTFFRNGLESGIKWSYRPATSWIFELSTLYDSGQKGGYTQAQITYSPQVSQNLILRTQAGFGIAHEYLDYSGLSEIYIQVSLPIVINVQWSIEPVLRATQTYNKSDHFYVTPGILFSFIF